MSQKVRLLRKSTEELDKEDFKSPPASENGVGDPKDQKKVTSEQKDGKKSPDQKKQADQKDQKKQSPEQKTAKTPEQKDAKQQPSKSTDAREHTELNGTDKDLVNGDSEKKMVTRSRSSTPQKKKKAEEKILIRGSIQEEINEENGEQEINGISSSETDLNTSAGSEKMEMEPLVLATDEPDPELEFDESSDMSESGKGSPVINRCRTRRSQTRNVSTPKSPQLPDDQDSDKTSQATHTDSESSTPKKMTRSRAKRQACDTDDDSLASDNLSTQAEAGSDSTRLDFSNQDSGIMDENSFLSVNKNRSLTEALRTLSSRRTIRQVNVDYRKQVLRGNHEKFDASLYSNYNNVGNALTGVKRKNRSISPAEAKRMKHDGPGLFTRLASPLLSIRNRFKSNMPTSTPRLTGYKNTETFENDDMSKIVLYGDDDKSNERKWCTIM